VGSAPGIQPDAPTSIFGSSLNQPETAVVSTPETPEIASEPATDGWVSYHEPVAPQAEPAAADVPESNTFGATVETTSGYDVNNDPQWDLAAPLEGSIFDQAPNNTSAAPSNPVDVATEVEQTLGELDSFSTFDSAEEPVQLAGLDMSAESVDLSAFDATGNEEVGLFDTDDELPLPDFTGVYDESQTGSAGKGVESGVKGISVGREELDKLRPSDEESQNAETAAQESGNLRLNKQFLLVLIFGIAVLVFFLITQPDAVEDMQRSIDSLLGRS